MRMPKWECPSGSHAKIKMGPNWDQHGNAKVGAPKCVPLGLPTWDQCGQPHFQIETWDPLGNEVGSSWKIVRWSQLGPTYIKHGQTHIGPCGPAGQNVVGPTWAAHVGPTTQPTWAPMWHSCWVSVVPQILVLVILNQ